MFGVVSYFHPSLIFLGKEPTVKVEFQNGLHRASSLAFKYWTWVEVADSYKHSSLLQVGIICGRKNLYKAGPKGTYDFKTKYSTSKLKLLRISQIQYL